MIPSLIQKLDNPKLEMAAVQLFYAECEQCLYALPHYIQVTNLDFGDHPCGLCAVEETNLYDLIMDHTGQHMFVGSDTDYCQKNRNQEEAV
ncbi:MAG: alpha-D-ribose 1-methylphosphonate 5-phosphate C-P-lyase PhnJ [Pseudomonadota bacterium]